MAHTAPNASDDRLCQDAAPARFYDLENGWAADFDFCLKLAENAQTVLHLGCGTGQLAARLAEGRSVVGVDPAAAAWRDWTPEKSRRSFEHPGLGRVDAWNDAAHDPATGIVTYQTFYRIDATGTVLSAASKIRFTDQEALASRIEAAGLAVQQWLGDWQGSPCLETSTEIIPLGRLR